MMSFGGGWFFVVQSEAISVLNKNISLPGLGSYMALATEKGDTKAALMAIGTMIFVVFAIDQLLWRPVVAWSQRYRFEQTEGREAPTSWVFDLGKKSRLLRTLFTLVTSAIMKLLDGILNPALEKGGKQLRMHSTLAQVVDKLGWLLFFTVLFLIGMKSIRIASEIRTSLSVNQIGDIFHLGLLTMGRVFLMVIIATIVWTPIGVWIGFRPRVARFVQPLAQIAASFPINMTFPFIVGFYIAWRIPINWGSILLMALGTQWYILFNVIAGASSIPTELKESAEVFGLRGLRYWRTLIIPAIFPYWITGACTAAGGAWNASIVAEFASWHDTHLVADGIGAFIAQVTEKGDWPAI